MSKAIRKVIEPEVKEELEIPKVSYDTDINTVDLHIINNNATESWEGYRLNAVDESVACNFYIDSKVDAERDLVLTISFKRQDVNADNIDMAIDIGAVKTDGSEGLSWNIWDSAIDGMILFTGCGSGRFMTDEIIIAHADFEASDLIHMNIALNEANRDLFITGITARYHVRRVIT